MGQARFGLFQKGSPRRKRSGLLQQCRLNAAMLLNLPRIRFVDSRQNRHQRCLARTIRADQPDFFARTYIETDFPKDRIHVELTGHTLDRKQNHKKSSKPNG